MTHDLGEGAADMSTQLSIILMADRHSAGPSLAGALVVSVVDLAQTTIVLQMCILTTHHIVDSYSSSKNCLDVFAFLKNHSFVG